MQLLEFLRPPIRALPLLLVLGCAYEHASLPRDVPALRFERLLAFPSWVQATHARSNLPLSDSSPIPVAAIRAVGADSLGRVYLLDAAARRVLVFDSAGTALGVIGEGYGEGPGEFQHPGDMHVGASGDLVVTDIGWRRVTRFDSSGSVSLSFSFGHGVPIRAIPRDSTLLVERSASLRTDSLVLEVSLDGSVLGAYRLGDAHQRAMAEAGPLGVITSTASGTPLYVTPYPARWIALPPEGDWQGDDLLPELATEHVATEGSDVPLSFVREAVLGASCTDLSSCLVMIIRLADQSDPANSSYDTWAYLIDSSGSIRGAAKLQGVSNFWRAPGTRRVFLAVTEPEPHVVLAEYSLQSSFAEN